MKKIELKKADGTITERYWWRVKLAQSRLARSYRAFKREWNRVR